ncbi:Hypothetical predicted protein [Olea europaea subsp. europaea]|uniref:Uncharacterized protein n=1 Tax=Olea europaea subsp. europaea TaxID=158383 RepID=A0A8S0PN64_OLEEU|nr:Hypothetical predicted protein [Olea europaea subsp. europaea]
MEVEVEVEVEVEIEAEAEVGMRVWWSGVKGRWWEWSVVVAGGRRMMISQH